MRTQAKGDGSARNGPPTSGSPARRLLTRTLGKAWDDGIFAMAAQAAYWETLSLPPLLLGLLGSTGYMAAWLGPQTLVTVQRGIIRFAGTIFNHEVVSQFIAPTVADILNRGRPDIISVGFLIALFAGSSAVSSLVDSVTFAHEQYDIRHPVWQRIFALLIYLVALVIAVATLPLLTLGPTLLGRILPSSWGPTLANAINTFYYPLVIVVIVVVLTTFYKAALPRSLPWHRLLPGAALAMLVFTVSGFVLRIYIAAITRTGYTYGALATPIAFLLFAFLIGFAVVLGAQLNNAIQEVFPVRPEHRRHRIQRALGLRPVLERFGLAREPAPAPAAPTPRPSATNSADSSTRSGLEGPDEPREQPNNTFSGPDHAATRTDRAAPE